LGYYYDHRQRKQMKIGIVGGGNTGLVALHAIEKLGIEAEEIKNVADLEIIQKGNEAYIPYHLNTPMYVYPPDLEKEKQSRINWEVRDYMNGKYTFQDVYNQIKAKSCPLSKRCRDYVLSLFDENGNWIEPKKRL